VYILDDYRPLRAMAADLRTGGDGIPGDGEQLLGARDAWWYIPSLPGQATGIPSQGSTAYKAANPELGPLFTMYLPDAVQTPADTRRKKERALAAANKDIPFPGWDTLQSEVAAGTTRYYLAISDSQGNTVRRLPVDNKAGLQRMNWDMRADAPDPISFPDGSFQAPWMSTPKGPLMAPGAYRAQLLRVGPDAVQELGSPQEFALQALNNLPGEVDYVAVTAFQQEVSAVQRQLKAVDAVLKEIAEETQYLRAAIDAAPASDPTLQLQVDALEADIAELKMVLHGNAARQRLSEAQTHSAASRISAATDALDTRMPATANQREDLRIGRESLVDIVARTEALRTSRVASIKKALAESSAPWVPGQALN
jgi:hypothetical protein